MMRSWPGNFWYITPPSPIHQQWDSFYGNFTFRGVEFETQCLSVQRLRELMSLWLDECRGPPELHRFPRDLSWKRFLKILFIFLAMQFNLKWIKIKKVSAGCGVEMWKLLAPTGAVYAMVSSACAPTFSHFHAIGVWKLMLLGKPHWKSPAVYMGMGGGSKRLPGWFGALKTRTSRDMSSLSHIWWLL